MLLDTIHLAKIFSFMVIEHLRELIHPKNTKIINSLLVINCKVKQYMLQHAEY